MISLMIVHSYPGYQIRFDLYLHSCRLGLRIDSKKKKLSPGLIHKFLN
jgi:hypothetical protein